MPQSPYAVKRKIGTHDRNMFQCWTMDKMKVEAVEVEMSASRYALVCFDCACLDASPRMLAVSTITRYVNIFLIDLFCRNQWHHHIV